MSGGDASSLQEQITALQQQLIQAQKLTALGELVSTTTHEFNNVLMTIINYAKIGLRHADDETREKAFNKILSAGQRASQITNSVLGIARNRSPGFAPVELEKLVDDVLVLLEREMRKYRIQVEKQFVASPPALADGNQIQQVLLNLLINARQAMRSGGRIQIRVQPDAENSAVDLVVRDTGPGMEPAQLRQIFDPFYSTKSGPDETGKGGTGLGLAACKDIIEAHRGRIRVDSGVGKGTVFTIKLPAAARATAPPLPAMDLRANPSGEPV